MNTNLTNGSERRNPEEAMRERLGDKYDLYCLMYNKTELSEKLGITSAKVQSAFPNYKEIRNSEKYFEEKVVIRAMCIREAEDFSINLRNLNAPIELEFPFSEDRRKGVREALKHLDDEEMTALLEIYMNNVSEEIAAKKLGISSHKMWRLICEACHKLQGGGLLNLVAYGYEKGNTPIKKERLCDLGLSARAYNALAVAGAKTINHVALLVATGHIYNINHLGDVSIKAAIAAVKKVDSSVECPFKTASEFHSSEIYKEWQRYVDRCCLGNSFYRQSYKTRVADLEDMVLEALSAKEDK